MHRAFLASLHCPYSGSPLSLSDPVEEDGEEINFGIVTSEAGEFPIVDGILRLQLDQYRESIVEHIHERCFSEAFAAALDEAPFHAFANRIISVVSRYALKAGFKFAVERLNSIKRNFVRAVTEGDASFAEVAEKLGHGPTADWQIYRFSMPTFLPVFPLVHIAKPGGSILDFGCGTGHASFVLSRMCSDARVICADYSFCSLYLAKKYFVPDATCVCLDGNYLLPFDSGQFSTVFSSDALQYIDSKLSLVQEFKRVGDEKAVILLPHLHNRLASPYAKSLTPRGYRELFQGMETRIMPEQDIMRDYFFDGALDLGRECTDEEVSGSKQGVSVVASADSSVFKRMGALWEQRLRTFRHPLINPAYRICGQPGSWQVARRARDRYAKTMSQPGNTCIPEVCTVPASSTDAAGLSELHRSDPENFGRLARSLVVLDLPDHFVCEAWYRSA
jgi:SAM-dependent methyltransferase